MVGLQSGYGTERAQRGAPIMRLEGDEADEEVAFDEVWLDCEDLPAEVARLLNLSPVQRLEALA